MTSTADGRTHIIAAVDFDAGLWRGTGIYRAICGTDVLAAAMASEPGPRCATCREAAEAARTADAGRTARIRKQRTGWIPRSLGRIRGFGLTG